MRTSKKQLVILSSSVILLLASCGTYTASLTTTNSTVSLSASSQTSSATSIAGLANVDDTLPSYEKTNYSSSYVSNDSYRNFYHIFVPTFSDSDGDGIGDLKGITDKLDYLRDKEDPHGPGSLGINGIFLSPIQEATSYHKYDIINYEKIDPQFGTMSDYEDLIAAAHDRGIKVILDLVLNHTSVQSKYFTEAVSALANYDTHDESGLVPSDFILSHPEVGYFRFIYKGYSFSDYSNRLYQATGNWYYEGFSSSMPDWNLDNSTVRDLHKEYIKYWLDNGADGYRLDAVQSYYGESTIDSNKNFAYINFINSAVKSYKPDAYVIGEGPWSLAGANTYMKNTDIDSYFNFDTDCINVASARAGMLNRFRYDTLKPTDISDYYSLSGYESKLNSTHIDAYFNSNHDVGRMTNQFAFSDTLYLKQLKFFYGFQNMFKGNYFMYYGDEIGLCGVKSGADDMPCRSPFLWGDSYTTKELEAGLNIRTQKYFQTFDEQLKDSSSLFNYLRRLEKIKDYNPEIARGTSEIIDSVSSKGIMIIKKTYNKTITYLLINFKPETASVSLSDAGVKETSIHNCLSADGNYASISGESLTLPQLSITIMK